MNDRADIAEDDLHALLDKLPADQAKEGRQLVAVLMDKIGELEEKIADGGDSPSLQEAVDCFLDYVERPTGTLAPIVPPSPASQRAIVALFGAAGRNL